MSILNYLPEFKVVEINRSTGLVAGHILSQNRLNSLSDLINVINEGKDTEMEFVENGFIVGLNNDLTVEEYDGTKHGAAFLLFTEELNRTFPGHNRYATEADADGDIYPRCIGLFVGDVFTTNNYDEDSQSDPKFAKVVDGVLTLQDSADSNTLFAVEESTLPTGEEAYRFTFLG